jgi:hypothetical protein
MADALAASRFIRQKGTKKFRQIFIRHSLTRALKDKRIFLSDITLFPLLIVAAKR